MVKETDGKPGIPDLTKRELEIMQVFWESDHPLMGREIVELSKNSTWAHSTLHEKLNRMVEKGAIAEVGVVKTAKTVCKVYSPCIRRNEYFQKICDGLPPCIDLLAEIELLLHNREVDVEFINVLEQIIKCEKKKKLS